MQEIRNLIQNANNREIRELLELVLERYRQLNPDWDISMLSLLKSGDRNEELDRTIQLLKNLKI